MTVTGLLYCAFFALAAGMTRHRAALLGRWQSVWVVPYLPCIGWLSLGLSLLAALLAQDGGFMLVTWFGLLPLTAGLLLLGLSYRPAVLRGGLVVALALVVIGLPWTV